MDLLLIFMGAALINNVILSHALGIGGMIDESKQLKSAFGLGVVVSSIIILSMLVVFPIHHVILYPLGLIAFNLMIFVLVILVVVHLMGLCLRKILPTVVGELGFSYLLITTNSAILGVILLGLNQFSHSFGTAILYTLGTTAGFILVMVLFAGIWERIQYNEISANFKGVPIAMITAGLMAIVFFGFTGLFGM